MQRIALVATGALVGIIGSLVTRKIKAYFSGGRQAEETPPAMPPLAELRRGRRRTRFVDPSINSDDHDAPIRID